MGKATLPSGDGVTPEAGITLVGMIIAAGDANPLTSSSGGEEREARRDERSGGTDSVELGDELEVQGEARGVTR